MKKFLAVAISLILFLQVFYPSCESSTFLSGKTHGICIRGDDLAKEGSYILLSKLKKLGYDSVFFLAKTPEGEVYFKHPNFPLKVEVLKDAVEASKKLGIKFYAYFPVVMDKNYASTHSQEKMVHIGGSANYYYVSLISDSYLGYVKLFISELLKFDVDGIVLDYIRFPSGTFDFSSSFISYAKKKGINTDKVREIAYKTFASPADWKTMFKAFEEGDPDVLAWVKLREEIVSNTARILVDHARSIRPSLTVGAFMVARGHRNPLIKDAQKISETWAYQVVNFAQEPILFEGILDFIAPMVYLSNLSESSDYTTLVVRNIKKQLGEDFPVFVAANPDSISISEIQKELLMSYASCEGAILFRYPLFKMANFDALTLECGEEKQVRVILNEGEKNATIKVSCEDFTPSFEDYIFVRHYYAYRDIQLQIDSKTIIISGSASLMDVAPFIKDSRTFVPVRFVSEALCQRVEWDARLRQVRIIGSSEIVMKIGSLQYSVNGELKTMDVAPFIENSRTFVPIRFVSEAMRMTVDWNEALRTVTIKGFVRLD